MEHHFALAGGEIFNYFLIGMEMDHRCISFLELPQGATNWVASTIEICFFTILEARNWRSRCQQGWFLLLYWQVAPFLSPRVVCVYLCPNLLCLFQDTSHTGLGLTHVVSFYLNYFFTDFYF